MFTGIIESTAQVEKIEKKGNNLCFWLYSPITIEFSVDQSISHNGICLTVESIEKNSYQVTAVEETIKKTNIQAWQPGDLINLERCLKMDGRLDGHIVQGHVDTTAICTGIQEKSGSWEYQFKIARSFAPLFIEKGSIAVNGISLTIFNVGPDHFTVAIIPYTYEHTNMKTLKENDVVNIEFDLLGKYIQRMQDLKNS